MAIFRKRKRQELREVCREMYGDDFIALYDQLGMGSPIGTLETTIEVLSKIERAKQIMAGKKVR